MLDLVEPRKSLEMPTCCERLVNNDETYRIIQCSLVSNVPLIVSFIDANVPCA